MILVNRYKDKYSVSFSTQFSEDFQEMVSLARLNSLSFNQDSKVYLGSQNNIYSFLQDIQDIESTPELLKIYKPEMETKIEPLRVNPEYLKLPPIKGKAPYEDFQLEGIKKAISVNRFYFADDMGLGKTYQDISALNHIFRRKNIDSVLIVCPSEAVYNWRVEIKTFFIDKVNDEDVYIADVKNRDPFNSGKRFIIMTYRTFLMLSDDAYYKKTGKRGVNYKKATMDLSVWGNNRAIILDEAHNIKNRKAKQSRALMLHRNFFEYRTLMSGTPYPNAIEELHNQIKFLDNKIQPKGFDSFVNSIAVVEDGRFGKQIVKYKRDKVQEFIESIAPIYIRRLSKDCLDLPEKIEKTIHIKMNDKQKKIYQELVIREIKSISKDNDGELRVRDVLNKFPYLLLAMHDPKIINLKKDKKVISETIKDNFDTLIEKWNFKDNSKLEVCKSLLDKYIGEEGRKVILWSGHPYVIDSLKSYFSKYNPIAIHGETKFKDKTKERNELLETFKHDPKHNLLIASYLVLKTAVNIVEATRTIYFDRGYDFVSFSQSSMRNYRIGSKEPVVENYLILDNTLETVQDFKLKQKADLNQMLMKRESLSQEEWKALFEGNTTIFE